MTDLFRAAVSITPTKRRRYWWVAWWSRAPCAEPFREPDAFDGGALTREEAKLAAERRAGMSLLEIEPKWARAWLRVRDGKSPWIGNAQDKRETAASKKQERPVSARDVLRVSKSATDDEIKRAFRARVLETHPDHGGDAASFIALKRAYDSLLKRAKK